MGEQGVMGDARVKAVVDTADSLIDYWMRVWLTSDDVDQRCTAAARLDDLLRAPAWPT